MIRKNEYSANSSNTKILDEMQFLMVAGDILWNYLWAAPIRGIFRVANRQCRFRKWPIAGFFPWSHSNKMVTDYYCINLYSTATRLPEHHRHFMPIPTSRASMCWLMLLNFCASVYNVSNQLWFFIKSSQKLSSTWS